MTIKPHPTSTSVWKDRFPLTSHDAVGITEGDVRLAEAINLLTEGRQLAFREGMR